LADCCWGIQPSAQSKLIPTVKKSLKPDSLTESCQNFPFTETLKNSTESHGKVKRKSSQEDFPVRTLAIAEKAKESKVKNQVSGRKWLESFTKFDPHSHSWKTHQLSLFGDWEQFLETWPRWGWMQDGECLALKMPELLTNEKESGSLLTWPTPTASEISKIPAQANYGQVGLNNHPRIRGYPKRPKMEKSRKDIDGGTKIQQKKESSTQEQLNPSWVEWLMGWPIGWTELKPLETAKFRNVQQWHSEFSAKDF